MTELDSIYAHLGGGGGGGKDTPCKPAWKCPGAQPPPPAFEIEFPTAGQYRAARQEVSFQPDSVDAVESTSDDRAVWRVTFTGRLPGQPPGLFETIIVEVDSTSGEVVSLARP